MACGAVCHTLMTDKAGAVVGAVLPTPDAAGSVSGERAASVYDGQRPRPMSAQERHWLDENRAALESSNAFVEQHGLPLVHHRMF
jgi:antitoxin CcdA